MPPLNGRLGLKFYANEKVTYNFYSMFANTQGRLSQRDKEDPRIDSEGTSSWRTYNFDLAYMVSKDVDFSFAVKNLSNERYREHASGVDAEGINVVTRLEFRI